jgi:hypothetical protein
MHTHNTQTDTHTLQFQLTLSALAESYSVSKSHVVPKSGTNGSHDQSNSEPDGSNTRC